MSYTEKEYDYAREIKKPVLGFIHGNRGGIARDKTEDDPQKRAKLERFIEKVRRSPVSFFIATDDLATKVLASFVNFREKRPAVGFIRANQAPDLKKYSELLEANRDLEQRLKELSSSASRKLADWFAEHTELEITSYRSAYQANFERITLSWREIALLIAPHVVADMDENRIFEELAFALLSKKENHKNPSKYNCGVHDDSKRTVRMQFVMKGLIAVSTEQRVFYNDQRQAQPYNARVWKLTELGNAQFLLLS